MIVMKFGGTSVGSVSALNNLKLIVEKKKRPCIVVVSAITGITNLLTTMFEKAVKTGSNYKDDIITIREKHVSLAKSVLPKSEYHAFLEELQEDLEKLEHLLSSVSVMKNNLRVLEDHILSMGEQFSSKMITRMFKNAVRVDGRELIVTKKSGERSQILWEQTCVKVQDTFRNFKKLAIVPGFCGRTEEGYITTLGRGGSDLSAAMIGAAIGAETIDIWTDVDGMMTCDPNIVPQAHTIPVLSYAEAAELCHFGAKVLYTPAIWPAVKSGIPIKILNTFNRSHHGTIINSEGDRQGKHPVTGITHVSGVSLITVFGNGLMGQVGTSYRLFGAMADKGINIIFISQASSEYSISFAVKSEDGEKALSIIKKGLEADAIHGSYIDACIEEDMAIIAVVGNKMRMTPGISGRIFTALGNNKINVVATAQGGSELNVSAVVKASDAKKAVAVLHDEFFGMPAREADLYVAGHGVVGNELLLQLKKQKENILKKEGIKISLKGLADTKRAVISEADLLGSYPQSWKSAMPERNFREFLEAMYSAPSTKKIFVDCTASSQIAALYDEILENGIHIVAANKIAASGPSREYERMLKTALENRASFHNETNAGAGLPIISTIRDMTATGDKIQRFVASLSGSLNFILNKVYDGMPLYDAVMLAKESGFTEPDPRIDLSGTDVRRKLLVLARCAGYKLEEEQITENDRLLPAELQACEEAVFYERLKEYGKEFGERMDKVRSAGKRLRYMASFDKGSANIGLVEVESDDPAYNLDDSNNIIMLYTKRYNPLPLVIKGYGAGAAVTAAGVFADILKAL